MKPILFNAEMVSRIQDGTKTVTRRPMRGYALEHLELDTDGSIIGVYNQFEGRVFPVMDYAPYRPGDILYVRETWCWCPCWDCGMDTEEGCCDETAGRFYNASKAEWGCYGYRASPNPDEVLYDKWRPSIHMPREAARIFLRVTDVRVEQLYAITGKQARAEGFLTRDAFIRAFLTMYPDCTVKSWVWPIEFERISKEEAMGHGD